MIAEIETEIDRPDHKALSSIPCYVVDHNAWDAWFEGANQDDFVARFRKFTILNELKVRSLGPKCDPWSSKHPRC